MFLHKPTGELITLAILFRWRRQYAHVALETMPLGILQDTRIVTGRRVHVQLVKTMMKWWTIIGAPTKNARYCVRNSGLVYQLASVVYIYIYTNIYIYIQIYIYICKLLTNFISSYFYMLADPATWLKDGTLHTNMRMDIQIYQLNRWLRQRISSAAAKKPTIRC